MIECTPQELLPIMPPRVQRSWRRGIGREGQVVLLGGGAKVSRTTPGSTRAMRRTGSISRMLAMYFEKSRTMAALQHCPASDVPPPRASSGARWSRQSATVARYVFFVARDYDSDRDLAVVGAIGGIESAAAGVEANFSAKVTAESGFERGGINVARTWPGAWCSVLGHRVQNIFEDAGAGRKGIGEAVSECRDSVGHPCVEYASRNRFAQDARHRSDDYRQDRVR